MMTVAISNVRGQKQPGQMGTSFDQTVTYLQGIVQDKNHTREVNALESEKKKPEQREVAATDTDRDAKVPTILQIVLPTFYLVPRRTRRSINGCTGTMSEVSIGWYM